MWQARSSEHNLRSPEGKAVNANKDKASSQFKSSDFVDLNAFQKRNRGQRWLFFVCAFRGKNVTQLRERQLHSLYKGQQEASATPKKVQANRRSFRTMKKLQCQCVSENIKFLTDYLTCVDSFAAFFIQVQALLLFFRHVWNHTGQFGLFCCSCYMSFRFWFVPFPSWRLHPKLYSQIFTGNVPCSRISSIHAGHIPFISLAV